MMHTVLPESTFVFGDDEFLYCLIIYNYIYILFPVVSVCLHRQPQPHSRCYCCHHSPSVPGCSCSCVLQVSPEH